MLLRYLSLVWVFLACSISADAHAHREYRYYGNPIDDDQDPDEWDEDGDDYYIYHSSQLCLNCFWSATWDTYKPFFTNKNHRGIDFRHLPTTGLETCWHCDTDLPVYAGYLQFLYKNDFPFLKKQIGYVKKHAAAKLFWPECSSLALTISNLATIRFQELVRSTPLQRVETERTLAQKFMIRSWYLSNLKYILHKAICSTCFHFSDYYMVSQDIIQFAKDNFNQVESRKIENGLMDILDDLAPFFRELYAQALQAEAVSELQAELTFIESLYNEWESNARICPVCNPIISTKSTVEDFRFEELDESPPPLVPKPSKEISDECLLKLLPGENANAPDWCLATSHFVQGRVYNDLFLHKEAVEELNTAIKLNPSNKDAYLERAHAYFEMGAIELALADYKRSKELSTTKALDELYSLGSTDYAQGLCYGVLEGSTVSAEEFIPTMISSSKGLLFGLWAFAISPVQVSQEFIDTSRILIEMIRSQTCMDSLQMVVPELRMLCCTWDKLSEQERGRGVGFIVGKYGLDVFMPVVALKAVRAYQALKAANTALTLEVIIQSEVKRQAILAQTNKRISRYAEASTAAKAQKLILKNPNQAPHVMSSKHNWHKVVNITGDPFVDCQEVIKFLEKHEVVCVKNLHPNKPLEQIVTDLGKLLGERTNYIKVVDGLTIEVAMETMHYKDGLPRLQNAFIQGRM